jgi:hypothetical protein
MASRGVALDEWRRLARRKLAATRRAYRQSARREAIEHSLNCPHEDMLQCPNFGNLITARLAGQPLREAHSHLHASDTVGDGAGNGGSSYRR